MSKSSKCDWCRTKEFVADVCAGDTQIRVRLCRKCYRQWKYVHGGEFRNRVMRFRSRKPNHGAVDAVIGPPWSHLAGIQQNGDLDSRLRRGFWMMRGGLEKDADGIRA